MSTRRTFLCISIKDININKIIVSNKLSFGKKNLNFSLASKMLKNRPLYVFLPKMSGCRRDFDETKYMSFLIKDDELLEKYNGIWEKVENSIKNEFDSDKSEFDSEPVYDENI